MLVIPVFGLKTFVFPPIPVISQLSQDRVRCLNAETERGFPCASLCKSTETRESAVVHYERESDLAGVRYKFRFTLI